MIFRDIQLSDKEIMTQKFLEDNKKSCEFCFANNYLWKKIYPTQITEIGDCIVLRFLEDDEIYYAYPIGNGDKRKVIEKIILYEQASGHNVNISGMSKFEAGDLIKWFPARFRVEYDRDMSDYIYTTKSLSKLEGRKYHSKRNHIARFKEEDWSYERITDKNVSECIEMNHMWKKKRTAKWDEMMQYEYDVVKEGLKYFKELELVGGLLRKKGKVVAFAIGEPLTDDTFVVHFEKAFSDVQGAYAMINQQFALNECKGYKYINREEDEGDEGLRQAKLSYHPEMLIDKYYAYSR